MNSVRLALNALSTRPGAPWLLDLFCGAGGAGMGYWQAGFNVLGVDIAPQPHYPFWFVQADALMFAAEYGGLFDAIHASPPCQANTWLKSLYQNTEYHTKHKDVIVETRDILTQSGILYVIENVIGAHMNTTIMLCGTMFGLKVYRHRLFESSILLFAPEHHPHQDKTPSVGRGISPKGFISITGSGGFGIPDGLEYAKRALGIHWMTRLEMSQAIPPAYTRYIGAQLMRVVQPEHAGVGG